MVSNLLIDEATNKIVDSVRDLETAKITLPLGNPNLKLVHTNQFLFTELPEDVFKLANMEVISKALNSRYSRFSGYQINRWYIEGVTITNDGKTGKMELDVNPFASDVIKYHDEMKGFENEYTNAIESREKANKNNTKNKSVKSVPSEVKLHDVKGFSKKDNEYIKKIVTKALKARNNPKNPVPIAFAIYDYYNKHHVYSYYTCMQKMRKGGFEKTWKAKGHNCGDGASTMVAMFRCAGLDADIMHKKKHFYVRVKIDGKNWYCDQAGATGKRNKRTLGTKGSDKNVWGGISKSASKVDFKYC